MNDINVSGNTLLLPDNNNDSISTIIYISSPFTSPYEPKYPNRFSIYLNISFNVTYSSGTTPYMIYYTLAIGQANNLDTASESLFNLSTGTTLPASTNRITNAGVNSMGFIRVTPGNYTKSIAINNNSLNPNRNPWYVYLLMIGSTNNVITVNNPKISCQVINRPSQS